MDGSDTTVPRVTNPVGLTHTNYPRNQWWVACLGTELQSTPLERWIMGLPIVLYRKSSGRPVALDGRCPHRWAPLSLGKVHGDDLACRYHGFRFGDDGRCTHIPTQSNVAGAQKVRSYPVTESGPFVWIWMGDQVPSEGGTAIPDLAWALDPSRVTASGAMEVACNYMALLENVLDLSHFAFVHEATLGISDWTNPPRVEKTEKSVSYRQIYKSAKLPAHYGVPTGIGCEKPVNREAWGTYESPAIMIAGVDILDPDPEIGSRDTFAMRVCHATTPIDEGRCYYWWFFSQDYGQGPDAAANLTRRIEAAYAEDKEILEASESMVRRDIRGRSYPEVSVQCDLAGIGARRRLQLLLEADHSN